MRLISLINIDVDGPASSVANTLGRSVQSGEYIGVGQAQAPLPHSRTPTLGGRSSNIEVNDWGVTSNFGVVDNVGGCFGNGMGGGIGFGYGVFGGSKPYFNSTYSNRPFQSENPPPLARPPPAWPGSESQNGFDRRAPTQSQPIGNIHTK